MSDLLDSAIIGVIARLKSEPQERWLTVIQEFALEVQATAPSSDAKPGIGGACADCGLPTDRCPKCAAKAVASGFVKDRAREAVSTYGPIIATKGLAWLQAALEASKTDEPKPDSKKEPT